MAAAPDPACQPWALGKTGLARTPVDGQCHTARWTLTSCLRWQGLAWSRGPRRATGWGWGVLIPPVRVLTWAPAPRDMLTGRGPGLEAEAGHTSARWAHRSGVRLLPLLTTHHFLPPACHKLSLPGPAVCGPCPFGFSLSTASSRPSRVRWEQAQEPCRTARSPGSFSPEPSQPLVGILGIRPPGECGEREDTEVGGSQSPNPASHGLLPPQPSSLWVLPLVGGSCRGDLASCFPDLSTSQPGTRH